MRGSDVVRVPTLAILGREPFENVRGSLARDLKTCEAKGCSAYPPIQRSLMHSLLGRQWDFHDEGGHPARKQHSLQIHK